MHPHLSALRRCLLIGLALVMHTAVYAQQARPADEAPPANSAAAAAKTSDRVRVMLVANGETTLSSATAARVKQLNAHIGLQFAKGHTLVVFECDEPQARLVMANAELAGAQETLEARVRMQGLQQASDVEVALAAAAVSKARGQIDLYRAQIGQCTITAPWSGRVSKVHVKNYMSATPGQPLLDLVKSGPLHLKLNLPSRLIAKLKKDTPLQVTIDETGKTYQARISVINSRVDSVSQTIEVEATMAASYPELLPGMSGVATLPAAQ